VRCLFRAAAILGLAIAAAAFTAGTGPAGPPQPPAVAEAAAQADRDDFPLPAEALARVGSPRLRHGRNLSGISYSPDGTLLVSRGPGRVRAWQADTGKLVWQAALTGGGQHVDGAFSADGKVIVVVDGPTCRWLDAGTGRELQHCDSKVRAPLGLGRLAPHGEMLAVADWPRGDDLIVYDLPSGRERCRANTGKMWQAEAAFSPDGKTLAVTGHEDLGRRSPSHVRLFDTATGQQLAEFDTGAVGQGVAFAPDGKKLLLHDSVNRLVVRDVPAGKVLRTIDLRTVGAFTAAFTPDSASVVVGTRNEDEVQFELASGRTLRRFQFDGETACLAFTPDGKGLASGTPDGGIAQWDLASGRSLAASADKILVPGAMRFADGSRALQVWEEGLTTLDWRSGREIKRVRIPVAKIGQNVWLSPDGSRVAGSGREVFPSIWDVSSGKEVCQLLGLFQVAAFAPDGKTLYAGGILGPIQAYDVQTAKPSPAFDDKQHSTRLLVVSPDGRRLATRGGYLSDEDPREITVWDPAARRELRKLAPRSALAQAGALAFSPDGRYLAAVGSDLFRLPPKGSGFVILWDFDTGEEKFAVTGLADNLTSVAYSADGRQLATGGDDGAVRLWEVATGKERHRFTGHDGAVVGVVFSPEGKFVAACSAEAPILVWDVEGNDGKPPATTPFSAEEKADLWKALDDADAAAAFAAMRLLLARPGPAGALLRERLRPAAEVGDKEIQRLVRDLDADAFAAREKAAADLRAVADRAEAALRKALRDNPPAEAKRRIEAVLESTGPAASQRRREARAVEVLERTGTAEARELLASLAGGAKDALLTREARDAVGRLKVR
jgi:WD40 repeat protein